MLYRWKSCLIGLLFALTLNCVPIAAQSTSSNPKAPKTAAVSTKAADYSQEAFVIQKMKTLYRFEKDGTGQRDFSLRVKVQSEAGLERFGQLVLGYSSANEKLEMDYVRVRKVNGTIVSASESDVQDLSAAISQNAPVYTDFREKHITVPGIRPGDTLEYHFIWHLHTALAPNNFWLDHDFISGNIIVLDDELEVNIPLNSTVKLKTEKGFEPIINDQADRRIYSWNHSNLERADKDDKDAQDDVKKKKNEDDDPKPPQVQMTTFQSWDDVGKWYSGLERDRIVPDAKVRAKAEELVRGQTSDMEKIAKLYEYVAHNFRYVSLSLGQGRYQPHSASDVFANQYGDCKDKHTLLSAMLIAVGLRAFPALMNSSRKIDADVPSPGQFDHVITAVPLGSETLWMDTTAEVAPFRLLSPQLRDKKALMIPVSSPAKLETTPADPPFLSTEMIETDGEINELGKLTGHTHMILRGDVEMLMRIMIRQTPESDWKRLGFYFSMVGGQAKREEISDIKPGDSADSEKPFDLSYSYTSNEFLDWSSKKEKILLPLPSVRLATEGTGIQAENVKPIQLGPPIDVTYRLKLTVPAKYRMRLPLPLNVTRDYADYSSSYKLDGKTLTVERRFHLHQHEIPSARAQDYVAFVAAIRADEGQTLSIETDVAGTPSIPSNIKVPELMEKAEEAVKDDNYALAEELYRRVLEKEPKHKDVRQQLASVLFLQKKYDDAISIAREQSKINPYDNSVYELLGRIFWAEQKYDESERAFRKQIEVTPLQQEAHENLGLMLVDARKYKEAIPELESAISLDSEDANLFVGLGRALLNLGQREKAGEAFATAIKLDPGPGIWNDVAYELSVHKLELDKARQYSESAVTEMATQLRNVELNRLTLEDLGHVSNLVAYWDTLGWVHFQQGDLDGADKYITAAWLMEPYSEVGFHLGQIFEKRGKADDAIHMYALAAVAQRPVPEARENLERLVGKDKSEMIMKTATEESKDFGAVTVSSTFTDLKEKSQAEFFVVLTPGPSRVGQVAEVKFIRGDEKLKALSSALKASRFGFGFPDESQTKLIRRGTLVCQPNSTTCSFKMLIPEDVTSVD